MKYLLFDTVWGVAGASAVGARIHRIVLPGQSEAETRRRLELDDSSLPQETPALLALRRFFQQYFNDPHVKPHPDIALNLSGLSAFDRRIYSRLSKVGSGKVITYGKLASLCKKSGAARAVGSAMARNPFPLLVPCHRVVRGDGRLGGFSGPGGTHLKERLLRWEGVPFISKERVLI